MIKKLFSKDYWIVKRSGLFDAEYYLRTYPDVRAADVDPVWHYCQHGWREGRNPSADFDTSFYLNTYTDVRDAGVNPLAHYIKHGIKEGRLVSSTNSRTPMQNPLMKFKRYLEVIKNNDKSFVEIIKYIHRNGFLSILRKLSHKADMFENMPTEKNNYVNSDCVDFSYLTVLKGNATPNFYCRKPIDIIIPVYNGYEFLVECYDSAIRCTDLNFHRLIIINDCSTDEKTRVFLKNIEYAGVGNIFVVNHEKNSGFIGSVNTGMSVSNNDVILLNSDTVVTMGWADKMQKCAYSRDEIGTVTALSNNATLCSVPVQWSDNELPSKFTVDDFAKLIENISDESYPEIPSPVGFCMYIKRECIDKHGGFDTIYGMGYAEENDFGMRIYRNGYRHVVDDATFIYHKGSMTFGNNPEKLLKIEKNAKILYERYPELKDLLLHFESDNTMRQIYARLEIVLDILLDARKKVLIINAASLISFPSGAFKHQLELIEELFEDILFLNLYSSDSSNIYLEVFHNGVKRCIFLGKSAWDRKRHSDIKFDNVFSFVIKLFQIDIVHFQTPQHFPLHCIEMSKKLGCKTIFTAHDFLLYCQNFTLIDNNGDFCGFSDTAKRCIECLNKIVYGYNTICKNDINDRKNKIKQCIKSIDMLISPSVSHLSILEQRIKLDKDRVVAMPHPIRRSKWFNGNVSNRDDSITIGFVGNFAESKGSKEFTEIVKRLKYKNIKWYIIGRVLDADSHYVIKDFNNVDFVGRYNYDELDEILCTRKIDLVLNPTKCYETYSYTLSECIANGIPVIASANGAIAERISTNNSYGWLLKDSYVDGAIELIEKILENRVVLEIKKLDLDTLFASDYSFYRELYGCCK